MQHHLSFALRFMMITALFISTSAHSAVFTKSAINPGDLGTGKLSPAALEALEFSNYVAACKSELEIDDIPQMDCNDINFRNPDGNPDFDKSTDYVTHAKINSVVDAVFACRWVHANEGPTISGFISEGDTVAASGEMIVHNKTSGKTCFFQMRPANTTKMIDFATSGTYERISTTSPPSPSDSGGFAFWQAPSKVLQSGCTQCHAAGPWIASPQIVGTLAQFGLINDGHDIKNERYAAIGSNGAQLNQLAQDTLAVGAQQLGGCTTGCHVIAGKGVRSDDINTVGSTTATGFIIIPSIDRVIDDVIRGKHMPPRSPYSDYRWVNLDNPGGAGGDWERLKDLKVKHNEMVCPNGVAEVQTHVVDSGRRLSTADFPDVLRTFNLLDGLVCNNTDQPQGQQCHDYQTRYHCPSGSWTKWRNLSNVDGNGDDESRANFPGLCSEPTEIQARTTISGVDIRGSATVTGFGPLDRLREFDLNGVACVNSSQPSGQCNDYTVRFVCAP